MLDGNEQIRDVQRFVRDDKRYSSLTLEYDIVLVEVDSVIFIFFMNFLKFRQRN